MLINGGCHCGNISFQLVWDPDPAAIPARACDCSFCTKIHGVWTSSPDARLKISVRDPSRVKRYSFGTRTAEFHTCHRCGITPLATSEIDTRCYAIVNVNTFYDVPPSLLENTSVSYAQESVASRLSRRKSSWIAAVEYHE